MHAFDYKTYIYAQINTPKKQSFLSSIKNTLPNHNPKLKAFHLQISINPT